MENDVKCVWLKILIPFNCRFSIVFKFPSLHSCFLLILLCIGLDELAASLSSGSKQTVEYIWLLHRLSNPAANSRVLMDSSWLLLAGLIQAKSTSSVQRSQHMMRRFYSHERPDSCAISNNTSRACGATSTSGIHRQNNVYPWHSATPPVLFFWYRSTRCIRYANTPYIYIYTYRIYNVIS